MDIVKYPRMKHVAGSQRQSDDPPEVTPLADLAGLVLAVAEKVDGANCGVSFDDAGRLLLQSRGHYLVGGPRERHFALLKNWGNTHAHAYTRCWDAVT